MAEYSDRIRAYADAYRAGIFTKDEAVGAVMNVLIEAPDFRPVWDEVPDWVQVPIRDFLRGCNEATTLYDSSSKSAAPINSRLLELKRWVLSD